MPSSARSTLFSAKTAISSASRRIVPKNFTEQERILLDYERELLMRRMHHLMEKLEIHTDEDGLKFGIMIGEGKASEVCNTAIHKYGIGVRFLVDLTPVGPVCAAIKSSIARPMPRVAAAADTFEPPASPSTNLASNADLIAEATNGGKPDVVTTGSQSR